MLLRSEVSPIIPVALLVAAFYFLVVRPTKFRQERAQEVEDHLKPGVEVMTTSGLFGIVSYVDETTFRLEIAPGIEAKFVKGAVSKIIGVEDAKQRGGAGKLDRTSKKRGAKPEKGAPPAAPEATPPVAGQDGDDPGPKKL